MLTKLQTRWKHLLHGLLMCVLCLVSTPLYAVSAQQEPYKKITQYPSDQARFATDNIWQAIARDLEMNHYTTNKRVQDQINWYKARPQYLAAIAKQAEPYLHYIHQEIKQRGLPVELIVLPIMESAFDPTARSSVGAAGLWQFMPTTGRVFGLKQNWWYDGRHDFHASTNAALNYLSYLSRFFNGEWLLAIASYDAGEGTLRKAVQRNEKRRMRADFWHLALPQETQIYIPRFLALAAILKNPERYGIKLNPVKNTPYLTQVQAQQQITLPEAAKLAEMNVDELAMFNPGYIVHVTDPNGPHSLMMPIANAKKFEANKAKANASRPWYRYRVKSGDTLSNLALSHDTTLKSIKNINKLESHLLKPGSWLALPKPTFKSFAERGPDGNIRKTYTVQAGDSWWKIAKNLGLKMEVLQGWNADRHLKVLQPGQSLTIWIPPNTIQLAENEYRVAPGDNLSLIATKYNTTVNELKSLNNLTSDIIRANDILIVAKQVVTV